MLKMTSWPNLYLRTKFQPPAARATLVERIAARHQIGKAMLTVEAA